MFADAYCPVGHTVPGINCPLAHAIPWCTLSPGACLSLVHTVPSTHRTCHPSAGPVAGHSLLAAWAAEGPRAWGVSPPRDEVCSCAVEASKVSSNPPAVSLQVVGTAATESQG